MNKNFVKFLLISLCFSCCLAAAAKTEPQPPVKQKGILSNYLGKIKEFGRSYKTKLEIKYYQESLKKTPNDVELLKSYAEFLKNHKYYDESIKIYNRLIEVTKEEKYKADIAQIKGIQSYLKKEKKFLDYIKQAQVYESKGNIVKANEYYLKAKKIMPERIEAKFGLAKTYGWLNNPKLAIQNYQDVLKETPDNVDFLEAYAKFLKEHKNYTQSLEIYKKLLALTKNEKYKSYLKEIISLGKGYTPKPTELESAKPTAHDKVFLGYIKQAELYESQGKIGKANEYYLKAYEEIPGRYEAKFGLAKTYGWLGQHNLALAIYQELLKESPNNPDLIALYNKFLKESKGYKAYKAGLPKKERLKLAKRPAKKPLEKIQTQPITTEKDKMFSDYIKQAQDYETEGKAAEANEYYLKASEIYPSRYETKFGLAKTYGWLHNDELAIKYYQELLNESPENKDLLEAYANYLKDNKYYLEAMQIYKKLFAQSHSDKYKANIAGIFFLQKDYKTSLKIYFDIYNRNPDDLVAQKGIALSYFVLGDFKKAICFYEKYLSQKADPESVVNYGKSLFYSKDIQRSKVILENYVCVYPNDIEGLSTLADIYVATKEVPKAMELICRAVSIEPENIKLRIQSAKIDIAAKNYDRARCLLLKLAQIEPTNTDITESLGDIAFYTGDFVLALKYYQCILNYNKNNRLNYKVAQSYHYGKCHNLAQNYYNYLLRDPEYSNKAKVGLAEIQITENKPLKARAILNNVLCDDPENIQAKKNLAVAFASTGDNYKSIKILETLPQDDDEVTYNLAKAYNAIERKDIALDLLENNPLKDAKVLQSTIRMQTKPAIEPIYHLYRETGDANAGKYQKQGGNAYYYIRPNMRAVGSIITAEYKNVTNIVSTQGTLYSVGLEGQPTNHLGITSAIGVEQFSNNGNIILGNALARATPNDVVSWTSGYVRSLDEIDSYMSAAGVIPSVGPFANQLVGRIIDNKYILANLGLKLPHKFYAYGGFNMGTKYGFNSASNFYKEIPAGFGKILYSEAENRPINQISTAYDFYYTGYNRDMSGFGGANLNNFPIGSDGGSPTPTAGHPGTGGYFSPTFFIAQKIPLTIKGSFKNTKLKYILSGFMGLQTMEGAIALVGGGSGLRTNPYYGYTVGIRYNENGKYGMGFYYTFNNYMTVAQHLLKVNLLIRF